MAAIDFEIDKFFGSIAFIRMDIEDYEKWCKTYESFNYPKWTMRDGNKIALGDMSDSHLNNTISMVERKNPANGWVKILKQEKQYRELKAKIRGLKRELNECEELVDIIF